MFKLQYISLKNSIETGDTNIINKQLQIMYKTNSNNGKVLTESPARVISTQVTMISRVIKTTRVAVSMLLEAGTTRLTGLTKGLVIFTIACVRGL